MRDGEAGLMTRIGELSVEAFDETVDTRRAIHAMPELGFEERATTRLIRERLDRMGLTALPCPTETGAVYELDTGRPGASVLVRADIDALPLEEEVDLPFRSKTDGVMHACGHDGHAAIVLSVARVLSRLDEAVGRFVFLFQPAEELGGGALCMIDGGVLDHVRADRSLGVHLVSLMPTGLVAVRPGVAMSRANVWTIHLAGSGGHGAMSGAQGNVVLAASAMVQALGGVVDGMSYEGTPCACSAGAVRAGTAPNVVPRGATIHGTLRTFTREQRDDAMGRLREACRSVAETFGVRADLQELLEVPPVENDERVLEHVRRAAALEVGGDFVVTPPPVAPSDDMSEFLSRIPGCHVFVGAAPEGVPPPSHHAPDFRIDERSLRHATGTLARAAVSLACGAT